MVGCCDSSGGGTSGTCVDPWPTESGDGHLQRQTEVKDRWIRGKRRRDEMRVKR